MDVTSGAEGDGALAIFAGGCFWCLEAVFVRVRGVLSVVSGYMGGETPAPTYEAVCSGRTGHAEVVCVRFDPALVRYEDLLAVFFALHDPTQLNAQGHDVGTQYRSAIFWCDAGQRDAAQAFVAALERDGVFGRPVVTALVPRGPFFAAEAWHQDYFARNPAQGYCVGVVAPKVARFRARFASLMRVEDV